MTILKGDKEYQVAELVHEWKVSRKCGAVSLVYKVPKEIAPTALELEQYIRVHDELF